MKAINGRIRVSASDLANFLACRHLTTLDFEAATGGPGPAAPFDVGLQALVQRGEVHEAAVLTEFKATGLEVVEITQGSDEDGIATAGALTSGADLVYQGVLLHAGVVDEPTLYGRPDFLLRTDVLSAPDGEPQPLHRSHQVVDAKLARSAKARAVLQSAFYTSLLTELQGSQPRFMHLALGNGELAALKVADFAAYERQVRRLLGAFLAAGPPQSYPEPVEHCAICRWSNTCAARRRNDDDLSLVAGMTARQRRAVKAAGILTRRSFADLDAVPVVPHVGHASLERSQLQARLQVESEDQGELLYHLLDPERDGSGDLVPNRGLLALPEPVLGDLFFDIEGARYYSEDGKEFGLEYLFGIVDTAKLDGDGAPHYTQIWCFDRAGEKAAFEKLIDFICERRERNPLLHVYHYNHYEPTTVDHLSELHETREQAVGRMMGRFATREDEVDDLFRLGVFVDLYRVVRQGLRAGVESYSLKSVEKLAGFQRKVDLADATQHLIAFEQALDERASRDDAASQAVVAGYNEDDCRATLALRDWLEERRTELAERIGEPLSRPVLIENVRRPEDADTTRIRTALLEGVHRESSERNDTERARVLLADLLEWHRREAKPGWWRYYTLRKLSPEELTDEPDAIGGLQATGRAEWVEKSVIREFSFPPQEHGFSEGDRVCDPITGKGWVVSSLDDEQGRIELRIGKGNDDPLPRALVPRGPFNTKVLAEALRSLGDRVAREGVSGDDPGTALLLRLRPRGDGPPEGPLRRTGEAAAQAAVRLALSLQGSYLPIQGPPGTGKTYTAVEQILALVAEGRRVGITGPSHAVIHHLIESLVARASELARTVRIGQRVEADNPYLHPKAERLPYTQLERRLRDAELDVAAGTAWMWARPQFEQSVDALFVDEAGQMSLANTLAVAAAGRNLVLLGDPQQLAQPSQGVHPPGAGVSALEHVLGERATMPEDAGLLLDRTWRMHPEVCSYVSEVFYDSRLGWVEGLENQALLGDSGLTGSGIRLVEVAHEGNTNQSVEEAEAVAALVGELLAATWRDRHGEERPMSPADVLVVTPYNAQVREIDEHLNRKGLGAVRVGTVDKFQGRQAPVVIYSMATSSAEEAPRGMEFLYDPHRLNVAVSRAQGMAVIAASPDLVRVFCSTPRQMVLANALCRAWEQGDPASE